MTENVENNNQPSISLENTILAFTNWRASKLQHGSNKPIPSELWDMVFTLEENGLSARVLKSALGLSSTQYKNQKAKRQQTQVAASKDTEVATANAEFAQAVINPSQGPLEQEIPSLARAANETRQQVKQLKITDNSKHELSSSTVIVECFHSEGHRLKIHATSENV